MKNNNILILIIIIFSVIIYTISLQYYKKKSKSISIMSWHNSLNLEMIKKFEQKTGIKINIKYYSSNEELISKLSISNKDIDIIFPSDYVLPELLKLKLIKAIDLKKIKCSNILIPDLLSPVFYNKYYYGVPYEWNVFGLVVNEKVKKMIGNSNLIYKAFFDGHYKDQYLRIAVINDIPTMSNITYNYYKFFFQKNTIYYKKNLLTIIYEILKKQKKQVILYCDEPIATLFSDNIIDIAIMQSQRYFKMIEEDPSLKLEFIFPNYHILKVTEYISISSSSEKDEICYNFINFMLEPEHLLPNIKKNLFFSPRSDIQENFNPIMKKILTNLEKNKQIIRRTESILNKKDMIALWMKLKS